MFWAISRLLYEIRTLTWISLGRILKQTKHFSELSHLERLAHPFSEWASMNFTVFNEQVAEFLTSTPSQLSLVCLSVFATEKTETERLSAWWSFHIWFATAGWLLLCFLAKNCLSRIVNSHARTHTKVTLNILLGYPYARMCVWAEQEDECYFWSVIGVAAGLPALVHSCCCVNIEA